jgi:redox-sensitive bicupin YhaK (pirin superfamily)
MAISLRNNIRKVTESMLGHSKPDPSWFGNRANPADPAAAGWTEQNWLYSRFHFNFAEWTSGPQGFGVMRVMNDAMVQPSRGFGTHPHSNAEIATYIVSGELTHQDSIGSQETLGRGSVQFMSAASGVRHSEQNKHPTQPCRFIQMWFQPRTRGGKPRYGGFAATDPSARLNKWHWLVGDVQQTETDAEKKSEIQLNQDVNIFATEIDNAEELVFPLKAGRQVYVLCIEGAVDVVGGEIGLAEHEALTVRGPADLKFKLVDVTTKAHLLAVEMASDGAEPADEL